MLVLKIPSIENAFKIDDKRKIDDRMFAPVFTLRSSLRISVWPLTSNGIVMDSFSSSVMHFCRDHRGLLFGITVEGRS